MTIRYLLSVLVLTSSILVGCKDEDDKPSISASNFSVSIDENPTLGQSIGTIQTSGDGYNNIGFYFNPPQGGLADHLDLNSTTGELKVTNPAFFDYEQRASASGNGIVEVFNSNDDMASASYSINITIRDVNEQQTGNPLSVQERLDNNQTPFDIYFSNPQLFDSLYGKTYGGGIITYLDTLNLTGFIVADTDLPSALAWDLSNPSGGFIQTQATNKSIGSGATNTWLICLTLGSGNYAAKACDDLVLNSKSDWFLPSHDEMGVIWENLHNKGLGNFSNASYWTSTESEFSGNQAYKADFSNPSVLSITPSFKNDTLLVRPMRPLL